MARRHQRPHLAGGIEPGAQHRGIGHLAQPLHHLVIVAARHVQARASRADLALVEEDGARRALDGMRGVTVIQHDDRALASELQRHAADILAAARADQAPDFGGTGEGNLVDAGMRH